MKAKEGHSSLIDWWPLLLWVVIVSTPLYIKYLSPEQWALTSFVHLISRNGWHLSAFGFAVFLLVTAWHSFSQWDDLNERLMSRLKIDFIDRTGIDRDLFGSAFRVRVTNESSQRLENVKLNLTSVTNEEWNAGMPYEVRQIRFPHSLPVTVPFYNRQYSPRFECGLNGGESELFDLALVGVEGGAMWNIALAPFLPNPDPTRSKWVSTNQFDGRLAVNSAPRKLFTFLVSASSETGVPTTEEKTLVFPGPNESGPVEWITPPVLPVKP